MHNKFPHCCCVVCKGLGKRYASGVLGVYSSALQVHWHTALAGRGAAAASSGRVGGSFRGFLTGELGLDVVHGPEDHGLGPARTYSTSEVPIRSTVQVHFLLAVECWRELPRKGSLKKRSNDRHEARVDVSGLPPLRRRGREGHRSHPGEPIIIQEPRARNKLVELAAAAKQSTGSWTAPAATTRTTSARPLPLRHST